MMTFKDVPQEQLVEFKIILDRYLTLRSRQAAQEKLQTIQAEIEGVALELSEVNGQLTVQDEMVRQLQVTVDLHGPLVALLSDLTQPGPEVETVSAPPPPKQKSKAKVKPASEESALVKDEAVA